MGRRTSATDAAEILRRRYVRDDPARAASVEEERTHADVAQMVYDRRMAAGLTQKQLADLVGTTQSVISRLEAADYDGHSVSMLRRISDALDQRLVVEMISRDPQADLIRFVFREVLRSLRRRKGLSVDALAERIGVERDEVIAMERHDSYRPSRLVLHRLGQLYGIPERQLAALAGAAPDVDPALREQASRFAEEADPPARLAPEEARMLDEFVDFLRRIR